MKIPNFRSGLDLDKVKSLYETLSKFVHIDEKNYTIEFTPSYALADILKCMFEDYPDDDISYSVTIEYNGNIISASCDDDEYFVGG